jgi:putative ABC transport system substrate-binding protein
MKRRDFITLLGAAATWPLAAHAQQVEGMRRVGVLMASAADDPVSQARIAAFHHGLAPKADIEWSLLLRCTALTCYS